MFFAMKLNAYLEAKSLSSAEFAGRIGVTRQAVELWRADPPKRLPRPRQLSKIEEETDGDVSYRDFYEGLSLQSSEAAE